LKTYVSKAHLAMSTLLDVLGGKGTMAREPTTPYEWVSQVEAGLPAASALAFKDALKLTNEELGALLGISTRTLARWQPGKSRLDAVSGDRLLRSARLLSIATDVLEEREAAAQWLKSPQRALAGAIPLALARTDVGARAVEALLGRMEHGVYT
jgi:putative toxin-antitoxin system antitoxin component (TIGR02293 family)